MPNWCSNHGTFSHSDPKMVKKLYQALRKEKVCETFFPTPADKIKGDAWYDWRVSNWGTKWDFGASDPSAVDLAKDNSNVSCYYDTAWSPPIGMYAKLTELGFQVEAYYMEGGMAFCGTWDSDSGDDCMSYSKLSDIPEDIASVFGCADWDWDESDDDADEENDDVDMDETPGATDPVVATPE